jgi:uncharacterized protein (DUF1501 family)
MKQWSRRRVLGVGAGAAAALASRFGSAVPAAEAAVLPATLVFITLRGGADALSLIVPYTDDGYYRARPQTAVARPRSHGAEVAIPLDARHALHPALAGLKPWFDTGELGVVLGVGTAERITSHRAARRVLETAIRRAAGNAELDPLAGNEAESLRSAAASLQTTPRRTAGDRPTASWLELHGWDTHMAQGNDSRGRFGGLARGLAATLRTLRDAAGQAWADTLIVVATEFGRSLGESALRGTEDGHASVLLLLGGRGQGRSGGRVLGSYPALDSTPDCPPRALVPRLDLETTLFQAVRGELAEPV